MARLLDAETFIQFFELDKDNETASLSPEATYKWLLRKQNDFTEDLRKWAEVNYPNAPNLYHCCFAGLVSYLATGAYGGYGTEFNQKERFAESKTYEFYTHLNEKLSAEDMTVAMIYFVASHILQKAPLEDETAEKIKKAVKLLEDSKKNFKSKQVAEARKILSGI